MTTGKPFSVCRRCGKEGLEAHTAAVLASSGTVLGMVCHGCLTDLERAEAEIKAATMDFSVDADGRLVGRPKTMGD